mgnify:CR=1 FL=1
MNLVLLFVLLRELLFVLFRELDDLELGLLEGIVGIQSPNQTDSLDLDKLNFLLIFT